MTSEKDESVLMTVKPPGLVFVRTEFLRIVRPKQESTTHIVTPASQSFRIQQMWQGIIPETHTVTKDVEWRDMPVVYEDKNGNITK